MLCTKKKPNFPALSRRRRLRVKRCCVRCRFANRFVALHRRRQQVWLVAIGVSVVDLEMKTKFVSRERKTFKNFETKKMFIFLFVSFVQSRCNTDNNCTACVLSQPVCLLKSYSLLYILIFFILLFAKEFAWAAELCFLSPRFFSVCYGKFSFLFFMYTFVKTGAVNVGKCIGESVLLLLLFFLFRRVPTLF